MPDLTKHTFSLCESAEFHQETIQGSKGDDYVVEFSMNHQNPHVIFDWSCDCPQYVFRKQYCKHIQKAQRSHCGWNQQIHGGEPIDGKCPKCGRDVIVRQFAA